MKGRDCPAVGHRIIGVGQHVGQHTYSPSGQSGSRSLHTAESFCKISDCLRESFTSRFWSSKDTTMYSIYEITMLIDQEQKRVGEYDRDGPHLPRGACLRSETRDGPRCAGAV